VSFQIFFGQVLQISLGEGDVGADGHFLFVVAHLHGLAEVAGPAADFDALAEVLCEVGGVEDLILDGLAAIDGEAVRDFGLSGLLLGCLLLDLGLLWDGLGLSLFCGHGINK
jgi:hypothetical protein